MVLNNIEKQGAIQIIQQEVYRDPYHENIQQNDFPLTPMQQKLLMKFCYVMIFKPIYFMG